MHPAEKAAMVAIAKDIYLTCSQTMRQYDVVKTIASQSGMRNWSAVKLVIQLDKERGIIRPQD